ncbi:MAG: hypothetical protein MEQ07_08600 [Aquimonas sp.]|nr:hypothetical protein [Aquimonas sp.]
MRIHARVTLLTLLLACVPARAEVSGHLHLGDLRSPVVGGIAWIEDGVLLIVLADTLPDTRALSDDGRLDVMDLQRMGGRQLELRIDPRRGEVLGYTLSQPGAVRSGGYEDIEAGLVLTRSAPWRVGDRVAGHLRYGRHAVEFDLPVSGSEIDTGEVTCRLFQDHRLVEGGSVG